MKKYLRVVINTWDEIVTYRLNFVMWRVRTVVQLLTLYFLWISVIPQNGEIFGYTQSLMLTYILGTSLLGAIVFSTRSHEIGENISNGDLSIFLIRPINYFFYWVGRDIGDKLMNIAFSVVELAILFFLLRPPIFIQTDSMFIVLALIATLLAIVSYFLLGAILGMFGFWSSDVWAPRFILFITLSFFAGGLFPLDILPPFLSFLSQVLPFSYLLYFPLKVYLGQLPLISIHIGLLVSFAWTILLFFLLGFVWRKGLKAYTAVGR